MNQALSQNFPDICRQWRQFRKLSQLELALESNVSQRHISWLETGRSQPSREMVVRLADAMEVPLRERNVMLQAAGFSALYRESRLNDPTMEPVIDALKKVLQHHDPLPAVVVDRFWNVRMMNKAAELMFSLTGDPTELMRRINDDDDGDHGDVLNLALLTVHPEGLRPYISNWDQAAAPFLRRLKNEALASGDPELQQRVTRYIELAGPVPELDSLTDNLLPVLPLELSLGEVHLSLFTVISTFGTPADITTDELRIEAFYPTDSETEAFFRALG